MLLGDRHCLLFWICVKRWEKPVPVLCLRLAERMLTHLPCMWGLGSLGALSEHFQAWEACKSGENAFYKADTRALRQESVPIQNKSSSCASFKGATEKRDFAAFSILQKLFLQTLVSLSIELVTCRAAPCYILYYAVNSQDFVNILKCSRPHIHPHTHTHSHKHTTSYCVH